MHRQKIMISRCALQPKGNVNIALMPLRRSRWSQPYAKAPSGSGSSSISPDCGNEAHASHDMRQQQSKLWKLGNSRKRGLPITHSTQTETQVNTTKTTVVTTDFSEDSTAMPVPKQLFSRVDGETMERKPGLILCSSSYSFTFSYCCDLSSLRLVKHSRLS